MKVKFNATNRKELVNTISRVMIVDPKYLGAPTFAYQIGEIKVLKDGTIESEDDYAVKWLIDHLAPEGITTKEQTIVGDEDGLTIWMPKLPNNAVENLERIAEAKYELFKRVFGGNITILDEGDRVGFPWFLTPQSTEEAQAYSHFIDSLCNMAQIQKRVSIKKHPVENEKYEFRCFLLRIGFIGKEYKEDRKILLANLEGSSAFKGGAR